MSVSRERQELAYFFNQKKSKEVTLERIVAAGTSKKSGNPSVGRGGKTQSSKGVDGDQWIPRQIDGTTRAGSPVPSSKSRSGRRVVSVRLAVLVRDVVDQDQKLW